MNSADFQDLCREASKLAVANRVCIGQLRLTQSRGNEPTIREPEMLHAFCRTLDQTRWQKPYGIEVPTDGRFRFVQAPGDRTVKARHDLVIFEGSMPDVLVELKREQPASRGEDYPAISKDLRKLLLEGAGGKAMFHICHASDSGTLPAIIGKYDAALNFAMKSIKADDLSVNDTGWFALMILVLYNRNQGQKPFLHSFIAPSLTKLLETTSAFQLDQFQSELIPRV